MLKQRLVGALILVALGVVFWPIIFMEPGNDDLDQLGDIPDRPQVAVTPVEPPDMTGLRASPQIGATKEVAAQSEQVHSAAQPDPTESANPAASIVSTQQEQQEKPRTRTSAPTKPAVDGDGVPIAWMLQVVTVSSSENADALRQRLLDMGHKAYVKRVKRNGKTLHRVYIGPGFEREKYDRLKKEVDREFKVQSMVARYLP